MIKMRRAAATWVALTIAALLGIAADPLSCHGSQHGRQMRRKGPLSSSWSMISRVGGSICGIKWAGS